MSTEPDPLHAWVPVVDALVGGIHHALNNRVAALAAVAQVMGLQSPDARPLERALADEIERLRAVVDVLTSVPRCDAGPPEPLRVSDLAAELMPLLRLVPDVRDIPCETSTRGDPPPVRVPREPLARSLLLALCAAARTAAELDAGRVELVCSPYESGVRVEIAPRATALSERGARAPILSRIEARALIDWMGSVGGSASETGGTLQLRLPPLATPPPPR